MNTERYFTTAGVAAGLEAHAQSYGIDIKPICAALDIDPASFRDITKRIGMERVCRLIEACAVISNDETFGLLASKSYVSGSTGPFGYGLISAPTVIDLMRFFHSHHTVVSHSIFNRLTINENGAETTWSYSPLITRRDHYVDMVMAITAQRLKQVLGPNMHRVEFMLERPKPKNIKPYKEILSPKLKFGAAANGYRIPADLLKIVNPTGDEKLFQLMDMQCRAMTNIPSDDIGVDDELREFIGQSISRKTITLDEVAAHFHLSERTLQRRLAERNTTLNDLRDSVRQELARKLLLTTDLSLAEIAERLGYSAPSAFTRSAIRWFGQNPTDYRHANKN